MSGISGIVVAIGIITLLVLVSAFFSLSELALAASRQMRLKQLLSKNKKAKNVLELKESPGNYFAVVQIGLNLVAIFAGAIGETILSPYFEVVFSSFIDNRYLLGTASSATSILVITSVFIIFADLIPKRIAVTYPEKSAISIVSQMEFVIFVLKPFIFLYDGVATMFLKLFKINKTNSSEDITTDDIYAVVSAGAEAGLLITQEQYLIENIFELKNNTVTSMMTSRDNVEFFSDSQSVEEVVSSFGDTIHQRIPIYKGEIDNIIGYVNVKALLVLYLREGDSFSLTDERIFMKALFIPDTLLLYEALDFFKKTGEDFAIVINEYGLAVGLITLKDVMSIFMGDLIPYDDDLIVKRDEYSWLISGTAPLKEVLHVLNIKNFSNPDNYETLSGLVMYLMRKIPKIADRVEFFGFTIEIVSMENYRVKQVLITDNIKKNSTLAK